MSLLRRIAAEHPEIMSMRNKAKNAAAKKAIGVGGNDSDSAGERKRLEHLRAKVFTMRTNLAVIAAGVPC